MTLNMHIQVVRLQFRYPQTCFSIPLLMLIIGIMHLATYVQVQHWLRPPNIKSPSHFDYILLTISFDNCCNPISFGFDAHDLVVVQSYSCIHEGVCHHLVNLVYTCMNT